MLRPISMLALVTAAGCAAPTTQMVECPATGCPSESTAGTPYQRALEALAVQDLQCPASALHYAFIPHAADAISGCGKKILYLRVCTVASPFRFECHPERARDWS